MSKPYCICFPHDGLLYVETPDFMHLRQLLMQQRFRGYAHLRTADGFVPYFGGGIAFHFPYLYMIGVKPIWYRKRTATLQEALSAVVADGFFASEDEADDFDGHNYSDECEWRGPRGMRFSLAAIEYIWLGFRNEDYREGERLEILRQFVPENIPIVINKPEPTGHKPCR